MQIVIQWALGEAWAAALLTGFLTVDLQATLWVVGG